MDSDSFDKWFAGFFDGEGSIAKGKFIRTLLVAQSLNPKRPVKQLFDKIKQQYGGIIYINIIQNGKYLDQVIWKITKREKVKEVIRRILPFIILRRKDLKEVLSFYDACQRQRRYVDENLLYSNKSCCKVGGEMGCAGSTVWRMRKMKRNYYRKSNPINGKKHQLKEIKG